MKKATLFVLIGLMFLLVGCSNVDMKPSGDPKEIINAYFQGIKDGNADAAYETLAEANKKVCSKEDFSLWLDLDSKSYKIKEFKIEQIGEVENLKIEKNTYKHAVKFTVTQTQMDYVENKEVSGAFDRYVVNDNGSWKVFREDFDIKESIAQVYNNAGLVYQEQNDLNRAATYYKKAIKYNPDFAMSYYNLGVAYSYLGRHDDAKKNAEIYISKEKNKEWLSNGYNLLGGIYSDQGKTGKAKEALKKALELNPENEYAKTILNGLK